MSFWSILALSVVAAPPAGEGWAIAVQNERLTVYARERKGSGVQEMRAEGVMDAPPEKVWRVLRDYDRYPKTMPYIQAARILHREDGDKVMYLYSVVSAPMVNARDYVIRVVDESDWRDGRGYLKVSWKIANERAPKAPGNIVRVEVNDGFWLLEPSENGKSTRAVYYLYTDPGGAIPRWIVNRANATAIPDVWEAVRRAAKAN
jgi:hypothetical protein